jgi:antitoxin HicB
MKKAGTSGKRGPRTGSSLESALAADGLLEEAEAAAIKRVIAWDLARSMKTQGVTKQMLATRMSTSRSQLDRLLDPENSTVQLDTVARAARALGKRLEVRLVATRQVDTRRVG